MRTVIAVLVTLSAVVGVYACNSFSGSNAGTTQETNDASDNGADGSTATNDGGKSGQDATIANADGAPPDLGGDIFDDTFEGESSCKGWTNGNTTYSISDAGHNGGQACKVCLSATSNIAITRYVAVDAGIGPYELDFVMMMPDAGAARSGYGRLTPYANGQAQPGGGPTGGNLLPGQWLPVQLTAMGAADGGADTLQIGIYDDPEVQGECFYIDDVRVFVPH